MTRVHGKASIPTPEANAAGAGNTWEQGTAASWVINQAGPTGKGSATIIPP